MLKIGRYQHFKGNFYQVLHIATDSETEEAMVVYQPEYGERDGKVFKRFQYVDSET